jgi:peroxiredoxin
MLETIRNADSLYYESGFHWRFGDSTYAIWMKKPGFVRLEASDYAKKRKGVLVGDGAVFWMFWLTGRPRFGGEDPGEYERNRLISFMRQVCPANKFSIAHQIDYLGVGMGMTILDPSVFHGYEDQMEPYLDGIRARGEEPVGDETCHVIEASFMDGQRIRQYWVARRDNLPRRLREIVRLNEDTVKEENWRKVSVDAHIPPGTFSWAPEPHWVEYCRPKLEDGLLKVGTPAPDFEHLLSDGTTFRLSRHRGKVVWLVFWRVGCQACRSEMVYLESVHQEYRDRGLIVIGFNCADKHEIVAEFLEKHSISFPTILDHSQAAIETFFTRYLNPDGPSGVPVNYIINKVGVIVDAWCDFLEDDDRGVRAVRSEIGAA